ncbi:MAG: hypothetical protein ACRDRP_15560 [Pseudonocardiaceae bacterium]
MSALLGAALGVGATAAVTSGSPAPSAPAPPATSSSAPAPSRTPADSAARTAETVPITFAAPATDASGVSLTVLRPEKVKGGVRLTVALANTTNAPIAVDTGKLGPHDQSFNGTAVPLAMTPVKKKLMPGEGYTYQCVITLPTMDVGQLAFKVGTVTVAGQAAGD